MEVEKPRNNSKFENLPQHIIHHIMNFFPYKEAAKLSVLSKTLHSLWLSFPVLDFEYKPPFPGQRKDPNHIFLSSILQTFRHRCPHLMNKSLQRLRVIYHESFRDKPFPFHTVFEELFNIAIKNKAKEVIFDILTIDLITLRDDLFKSQFLTVLKLKGFRFPVADSIILCPKLKELMISFCKGLRTITVSSITMEKVEISDCNDDEFKGIQLKGKNLMDFCFKFGSEKPQLCDINLSSCESVKCMTLYRIEVSNQLMDLVTDRLFIHFCDLPENLFFDNPTIKVLEMWKNDNLKNMFLLAPNLESFVYYSSKKSSVDILACKSLKVLKLHGVTLTDECVRSTLSDLGCLRELTICDCDELEKIELKNDKLEMLSLKRCCHLKEANVDAPNLHTFDYDGRLQVYPMQILSTKFSTAKIRFPQCNIDPDSWFGNMKRFLSCFDQVKDLSIVCYQTKDLIFPSKILKNDAYPLYDTKHIKVTTLEVLNGHTMRRLVKSILRLVHKPLELKLIFMPGSKMSTLKFEYGNIVKRKKVEKRCCLGTSTKCWRHYVLKVDFQNFDVSYRRKLDKLFDPYISL